MHFQFANGLANRRAIDTELAGKVSLRGQGIAGAQGSFDDALLYLVGDLPVGRVIVERRE